MAVRIKLTLRQARAAESALNDQILSDAHQMTRALEKFDVYSGKPKKPHKAFAKRLERRIKLLGEASTEVKNGIAAEDRKNADRAWRKRQKELKYR